MADDAPSPPPAAGTKGALDEAAELLRAPPEGTVLRPYIRAARETVVGAVDAAGAQADDLRRAADAQAEELRRRAEQVVPVGDNVVGASIRPDLKLGVFVGLTAVLSARFGPRAFLRNTGAAALGGSLFWYPDSLSRAWRKVRSNPVDSVAKNLQPENK